MMSRERSGSGAHQELNFSLGTYMTVEEVEQIFRQKDLKRSLGVGPIQPAPNTRGVFQLWAIFIMVILVEWVVLGKVFSKNGDGGFLLLMLGLLSVLPILSILYLWNFDVQRWSESDYSPYSSE
jgi:tetrahydromethanopterin S-methyltransferase subunit E